MIGWKMAQKDSTMDGFTCEGRILSGGPGICWSIAPAVSLPLLVSSEIKLLTRILALHYAVFGKPRYLAARRVGGEQR